jgi:hypothetical protein
MNETPSSPSGADRTVVVNATSIGRLRTLTTISLVLNGLIILFLLLVIIGAHHKNKNREGSGGRDGYGGRGYSCENFHGGFRHHFHHFGYGGFGGGREGGFGSGARFGEDHGFGGNGGGFGFHGGRGGPEGGFGGPSSFGPRNGGMAFGGQPQGGFGGGMENRDPAQMTDAIVAHLAQMLSLTDDQKAKIKPLVQADVEGFQKDAEALRQTMAKRIEDAKAKIKPILNADQQKELDQMPVPGQKPADGTGDKSEPAAK